MRIAILTHPLGTNYGGMLQNYALQQVLRQMEHQPVTLDYQFGTSWKTKLLSFGSRAMQRLKGKRVPLRAWPTKKESAVISQYTRRFINEHISTSEPFLLGSIANRDFGAIEAIIVGSDQVWRGKHSEVPRFFLSDFQDKNCKKIAYAASFGVDYWEFSDYNTQLCRNLIKQFNAISVREKGGMMLCEDYFDTTPELVLDPTLLLRREDYEKLLVGNRSALKKDGYLMTYVLDKDPIKEDIIEKVSKSTGLPQITVMVENYFSEVGSSGLNSCIYPPVEDWIQGFKDADYVVTDSFHGTVISIIFHKPFVAIVNKKRGADRFTSLLSQLHLENRLVDNAEEALALLNSKIDYEAVDAVLDKKRQDSINFLKKALQ